MLLVRGGTTQGATRGRRLSSLSATQSGVAGGQRKDLPDTPGGGYVLATGEKTAEAIQQEVAREVAQLLRIIFSGRCKTGRLDLEATEMVVRSAMYQAGATALTQTAGVRCSGQRSI